MDSLKPKGSLPSEVEKGTEDIVSSLIPVRYLLVKSR